MKKVIAKEKVSNLFIKIYSKDHNVLMHSQSLPLDRHNFNAVPNEQIRNAFRVGAINYGIELLIKKMKGEL